MIETSVKLISMTRYKAEKMLKTPRHVLNKLANPTEAAPPDIRNIPESYRWWHCPAYQECLKIAATANWKGWTCHLCTVTTNRTD